MDYQLIYIVLSVITAIILGYVDYRNENEITISDILSYIWMGACWPVVAIVLLMITYEEHGHKGVMKIFHYPIIKKKDKK